MVEIKLANSVHVIDNGVRCFVPPCFMYDLINTENVLIATVSLIDADEQCGLKGAELLNQCVDKDMLVDGVLVEYNEEEGGPSSTGVKLVINRIHK